MKTTIIMAVAVGLGLTAATSQAQIVLASGPSTLKDNLIGTSGATGIVGTVSSWVLSDYNGYTSGLTFVYQIVNNGPDPVTRVTFNGFGSTTIVNEFVSSTLTLGVAPTHGGFAAGLPIDGSVDFNASTSALPKGGDASQYFIIETTASYWGGSTGEEQDGFQGVGPTLAPVPEPTTILAGALMLLPLGVGAFRAIRKDRVA